MATVALVVGAWRVARPHHVDGGQRDRVAVLPFTVRSQGSSAYLREGTATLLALALDGAGRLRIVDPNAVLSIAPPTIDIDAGRRLAATLGAGHFVIGEIESAGPRLQLTATLYDENGQPQARGAAVGDEPHLFELVDSIARRMAIGALTDSSVRLANDAASATRSLAAFKAFLVGEGYYRDGHLRRADVAWQQAVAADSAFGLAWYRLSLAREWTGGEISSDSAAALAERFSSRLPDRDRELLAARRAFVRRDLGEGERLARLVLASYPTDADAWAQLGEMQFHFGPNVGRPIDASAAAFQSVLRLRPHDLLARVHLTRIAAVTGDTALLNEETRPDGALGDASEIGSFELTAMRAVVLGDAAARDTISVAAKRATEKTVVAALWRLAIFAGDPIAALHIAQARHEDGVPSPGEAVISELTAGRLIRGHSMRSDLRNATVLAGLMFALPSAPTLDMLARQSHEDVVALIDGASPALADAALIAARMLEARYPTTIVPSRRVTPRALSSDEARTVEIVAKAVRELPSDPSGALASVSHESLDDDLLYRTGLLDVVASVRAEAMHALHRDTEAVSWLHAIGMNAGSTSEPMAFAARRASIIEAGIGDTIAAHRDWARFVRRWRECDPALRPLLAAEPK
jgi:TolB-like protein